MDANIDQKKRLVDGNTLFMRSVDPRHLKQLATGQHPFYAILACSDSRVDPARIFSLDLGDAFVVRSVGNTVADAVALGSLEYAVEHLHVKGIIVLGHTGCGAVRAAVSPDGSEPARLRAVLKDIEKAKYRLPADQQNDLNRIAENNVRLQLKAIEGGSTIISRKLLDGSVHMFGAIYDISTGNVQFIS